MGGLRTTVEIRERKDIRTREDKVEERIKEVSEMMKNKCWN